MSNSNLDNFTKSEETSQDIHNKVSTSRDLQSTASSLVNQILNCTNQTEKGLLVGKLADLPWDYFENQHPGIFALDLFLYSAMEKIVLVNGAPTGIDVVPNWMSSYVFLVEEELSGYAAQVAKWSLHFYTDDYFTHSATQQYVRSVCQDLMYRDNQNLLPAIADNDWRCVYVGESLEYSIGQDTIEPTPSMRVPVVSSSLVREVRIQTIVAAVQAITWMQALEQVTSSFSSNASKAERKESNPDLASVILQLTAYGIDISFSQNKEIGTTRITLLDSEGNMGDFQLVHLPRFFFQQM